jgi:hypothetical protein
MKFDTKKILIVSLIALAALVAIAKYVKAEDVAEQTPVAAQVVETPTCDCGNAECACAHDEQVEQDEQPSKEEFDAFMQALQNEIDKQESTDEVDAADEAK